VRDRRSVLAIDRLLCGGLVDVPAQVTRHCLERLSEPRTVRIRRRRGHAAVALGHPSATGGAKPLTSRVHTDRSGDEPQLIEMSTRRALSLNNAPAKSKNTAAGRHDDGASGRSVTAVVLVAS
jgi:hypothetical protein